MPQQAEGILEKGWHLLARLHIIERAFPEAVRDDTRWEAEREAQGFETMTRSEAQSLDNNDWNLIALSTATGRNMKATLELFGRYR